MAEVWYTTREAVMAAPDVKASAWAGPKIDKAIASASSAIDHLCHLGARDRGIPGFAPWTGTLTFDWPNEQNARSGRLWLDQFQLNLLTGLVSGGSTIDPTDVLMEPVASGPPYSRIDLRRSTSAAFSSGSSGGQQSLELTGVWAGAEIREPAAATLSAGINSSVELATVGTTGLITPIGIGSLLRIGTERMIVIGKNWADSTQTGSLSASNADQLLAVSSGAAFSPGEELLIGAERVLVRDIAGNNLIVQRAWSGSTLAAHSGAPIYYARTLVLERGVLGTSASSHSSAAIVYAWQPPPMIETLAKAYAIDTMHQEGSGYARIMGEGEAARPWLGRALRELEERVYGAYGRRYRFRTV